MTLRQPASGYRVGIDAVLLAAAVPAGAWRVADLGCGAGGATLCLAARLSSCHVSGIDLDLGLCDLARANAAANGVADRVTIVAGDIARPHPALAPNAFDAVMANPPFHDPRGTRSTIARRDRAKREGEGGLEAWIAAALRLAKPRGAIVLIHRADRLADMLAGLSGRVGAIEVIPLWPRAGEAAKRVIVRARKAARAPMTLAAGLVLHQADGAYTPAAEAIVREAGAL